MVTKYNTQDVKKAYLQVSDYSRDEHKSYQIYLTPEEKNIYNSRSSNDYYTNTFIYTNKKELTNKNINTKYSDSISPYLRLQVKKSRDRYYELSRRKDRGEEISGREILEKTSKPIMEFEHNMKFHFKYFQTK